MKGLGTEDCGSHRRQHGEQASRQAATLRDKAPDDVTALERAVSMGAGVTRRAVGKRVAPAAGGRRRRKAAPEATAAQAASRETATTGKRREKTPEERAAISTTFWPFKGIATYYLTHGPGRRHPRRGVELRAAVSRGEVRA